MPTLRDLQVGFAAAVFGADDGRFAAEVRDGRFAGARLLQIYRNNTFTSLTGALEAVYPVVARLVGTGFFGYAADGYIRRHPSASGNLHDFGAHFPDFLGEFPAAASLPYLPDVARLEWAYHEVFHATEHAPLALDELAAVPTDAQGRLILLLHPAARLLASAYPVLRIWQANQPGVADEAIDLAAGGERLLALRRGLAIEFRRLGAGEFGLLQAFAAEQTFAGACTTALAAEPGLDLPAVLREHVLLGSVAGFGLAPGE